MGFRPLGGRARLMEPVSWEVRDAGAEDARRLAEIYAEHVLGGVGTFEEVPPSADEMDARRRGVQALDLPFCVLTDGGEIRGFAYAAPFRARSAYRFAVEDSVYVARAAHGRGGGQRLLGHVLETCAAAGLRQMLAVIGDSANASSIRLHAAMGFSPCGTFRSVGYKQERWLDVVLMQKELNGGALTPPSVPGLRL